MGKKKSKKKDKKKKKGKKKKEEVSLYRFHQINHLIGRES